MPTDQKPSTETKADERRHDRSEEARLVVEEYANGLRELIAKLRQRFN